MSHQTNDERQRIASGFHFVVALCRLFRSSVRHHYCIPLTLVLNLLLIGIIYEYLAYNVGLLVSKFYSSLLNEQHDLFLWTVHFSLLFIVSISLAKAVQSLIAEHLAVYLRELITDRLHRIYFTHKHYYYINLYSGIDNPDQRFTNDVGETCRTLSSMLNVIVINPFLVVFYSYKCVEKAGWLGPVSAYILFAVFTILTRLLITWSSAAVFEEYKQEGYFRYLHAQFRGSAESVAFLDVASAHEYYTVTTFYRLLHAVRVNINRKSVILFVTSLGDYVGGVLNYYALGTVLFAGLARTMTTAEIGTLISENSFYLLYLINKLTSLVDLSSQVAHLVGVSHRILKLNEALQQCTNYDTPAEQLSATSSELSTLNCHTKFTSAAELIVNPGYLPSDKRGKYGHPLDYEVPDDIVMCLKKVSVRLPVRPHSILVHDLSLELRLQNPLLITGPSGVGKTALLRVLAELWPASVSDPCQPQLSHFHRLAPDCNRQLTAYVPQKLFLPTSAADGDGSSDITNAFVSVLQLLDCVEKPVRSSSVEAFSSAMRALQMAYLILRLSKQLPLDEEQAPPLQKARRSSTINTLGEGSSFQTVYSSDNCDGDCASIPAQDVVSSVSLEPVHESVLCGYSAQSFIDAINLLSEFRLVDALLAVHLCETLQSWSQNPNRYPTSKQQCACITAHLSGSSWLYRLINWSVGVARRSWCLNLCGDFNGIPDKGTVWQPLTCSPGEAQRLVLSAVCHRRPRLVFLDEATSQMSEADEAQAYRSLLYRHITTVSVAHRTSVRAYHKWELKLFDYTIEAGCQGRVPIIGQDTSQKQNWKLVSANGTSPPPSLSLTDRL